MIILDFENFPSQPKTKEINQRNKIADIVKTLI